MTAANSQQLLKTPASQLKTPTTSSQKPWFLTPNGQRPNYNANALSASAIAVGDVPSSIFANIKYGTLSHYKNVQHLHQPSNKRSNSVHYSIHATAPPLPLNRKKLNYGMFPKAFPVPSSVGY
ncbi:hypothetical protein M5689_005026 [Euphorbia peplus]|nr:hypothetical protein M5689_005026 [Euphorbia peplus]